MVTFLERIVALLMSVLTLIFSSTMPMNGRKVDEQELSCRYQHGSWSGSVLNGCGHTAEVKNGLLFVDGERSVYPADSSVSNQSNPICSDENGTWFEDHENNEVRHDLRGKNLCVVHLKDVAWNTKIEEDDLYIFSDDGSLITIVNLVDHTTPGSVSRIPHAPYNN